MSTAALSRETYLLDEDGGVEDAAAVYSFIEAHEAAGRGALLPRYFLVGAEQGDQVEIPGEVHRVLRQVADAMRQGLAVTVVPQSMTLTSQEAADLLGVSRPTLIKMLDAGRIAFEKVGTHRRIQLRDLLTFREQRRADQYAALAATVVDLDDEESVQDTLKRLKVARRAVAARHAKQA